MIEQQWMICRSINAIEPTRGDLGFLEIVAINTEKSLPIFLGVIANHVKLEAPFSCANAGEMGLQVVVDEIS